MTTELIKVTTNEEGKRLVSARELHKFLGLSKRFSAWISQYTDKDNKYDFENGLDFIKTETFTMLNNRAKRKLNDYNIIIDMAKLICQNSIYNENADKALLYFNKEDGKEVIQIKQKRLEYQFGDMLEKITGFKWDKQYPIDNGKYRLDFKLGNTLIVEYDENHHKYQEKEDSERIEYCIKWLASEGEKDIYGDYYEIPVIRVKEGLELEGIREVMDFLIADETITNYNEKCVRSKFI